MANFRRVIEFAKFAGEWPFLRFFKTYKIIWSKDMKFKTERILIFFCSSIFECFDGNNKVGEVLLKILKCILCLNVKPSYY
jgi:hypothetical protein